eukprot:3436725-Rhodomonas_salina.1
MGLPFGGARLMSIYSNHEEQQPRFLHVISGRGRNISCNRAGRLLCPESLTGMDVHRFWIDLGQVLRVMCLPVYGWSHQSYDLMKNLDLVYVLATFVSCSSPPFMWYLSADCSVTTCQR